MQTVTLREELHQYIDQADDRLLKLIYCVMMKADQVDELLVPDFHQDMHFEKAEKASR